MKFGQYDVKTKDIKELLAGRVSNICRYEEASLLSCWQESDFVANKCLGAYARLIMCKKREKVYVQRMKAAHNNVGYRVSRFTQMLRQVK